MVEIMFYKTQDGRILELDEKTVGEKLPAVIGEPTENVGIYKGVKIIHKGDHVDDLFNRYIIISGRMITVYNKFKFGKLKVKELLEDIKNDKKKVYGAVWVYGQNKEPNLKTVAIMNKDGSWTIL